MPLCHFSFTSLHFSVTLGIWDTDSVFRKLPIIKKKKQKIKNRILIIMFIFNYKFLKLFSKSRHSWKIFGCSLAIFWIQVSRNSIKNKLSRANFGDLGGRSKAIIVFCMEFARLNNYFLSDSSYILISTAAWSSSSSSSIISFVNRFFFL